MKKSYKGLLIITIPFVAGFLIGFLVRGGCNFGNSEKNEDEVPVEILEEIADSDLEEQIIDEAATVEDDVDGTGESTAKEVIYYGPRLKYAKLFADLNEKHLEVAKQVGLKGVPETRSEVDTLAGLVRVSDTDCYVVDDLRYSMPFLTEGAAGELNAIGEAFRDSLKSKNLLDYKLIVSSLLRTEEDVRRLRRSGNPNASDNSAHCYATTFDITYTRYWSEDESEAFMQPYELTKVLGEVLRDRKAAGKCLVKYERKEHCFHITSCQ
jgi:hypothetical protein